MASKEARNYVAAQIKDYHALKGEIENMKKEAILETAFSHKFDSVGDAVSLLVNHRTLQKMEEFVKAFEEVYNALSDEKKRSIELLYWNNRELNCIGVGMMIGVDGSTVGRWRVTILNDIADRMGMK